MEQRRNYTIDVMRLVMALFIVALHSNPFVEYNELISYFTSQVMSRLGVPFFSAIAGYYFCQSNSENKYRKTILRYLRPYFLWSVIYFIYGLELDKMGGILQHICDTLTTFLFTGFYHLWYMLAIIYTVVVVWIAEKFRYVFCTLYYSSLICLLIGILMFGYGNLFFSLPIIEDTLGHLNSDINMQTQWIFLVLPFFMMGYKLNWRSVKESRAYRRCELLLILAIMVYLAEVMILHILDFKRSTTLCFCTYPIVYFLLLLSLKHPDLGNKRIAKYSAGEASFMYFGHIFFVLVAQRMEISNTPTYVIAVLLSVAIGGIIVKLNHPIMNMLI